MKSVDNQIIDNYALIHYKNIPKLTRINKPYKMSEIQNLQMIFKPNHRLAYLTP